MAQNRDYFGEYKRIFFGLSRMNAGGRNLKRGEWEKYINIKLLIK